MSKGFFVRRKVVIEDGFLKISFYTKNRKMWLKIKNGIKKIPGAFLNGSEKVWSVPDNIENRECIKRVGFVIPNEEQKIENKEKFFEIIPKNIKRIHPKKLPGLYAFQRNGVAFLESRNGNGLIADPPGLGKTIQAIGYCMLHSEDVPVLVICPATVKYNWESEIQKWLPGKSIYVCEGGKPKEAPIDYDYYIINYDILKTWLPILQEMGYKIMIADEVQRVSNPQAQRTNIFCYLHSLTEKFIALSGTPAKNRPAELFTILNLLDPQTFSNRENFLWRYCRSGHNGIDYEYKGLENAEELHMKIQPLIIRRDRKNVLKQLPDKIKTIVMLPTTKREMKNYLNEKEEFRKWACSVIFKEEKLTLKNSFANLKQAAYLAKRKAVFTWIDDYLLSGEKLVVFTYHKKVIMDLFDRYKNKAVMIDGSTSNIDRKKRVDQFQNENRIRLFFGQIKAAGEGITLTAGSAVAIVEFGWTPADHEQAEDRINRIGQKRKKVFAYYLVSKGTIESVIVRLLNKKQEMLSQVLDGKKQKFIDNSILEDLYKEFI